MGKKKTNNKELKVEEVSKIEAVKIPNTKHVDIVMNGKDYKVGYQLAKELIEAKKAKLK